MKTLTELFKGRAPGTVLFDLDGTLVDSAPDLSAAIDQMLRALGRPSVGEERIREWVGNGAEVLVRRALAGTFHYERDTITDELTFRQALDLFFTAYDDLNGQQAQVYDGVEVWLSALHSSGCRLGVVTNKPHVFTGPLLKKVGLDHWFEVAVSADSLSLRKPDPAPLLHAMNQLGGTLETTLMVGDSINDIQAARNAGMPVVAVRYGYACGTPVDELGADIVVDSLAELL